jgi:transformer-2 protein
MYTQERELRDLFTRYGPVDDVQVVYDHQTGRSRGFAFVYMHNIDDAAEVSKWRHWKKQSMCVTIVALLIH